MTSKHLEAREIAWKKQAWSDAMEYITRATEWHRKNPNWFPQLSRPGSGEEYSGSGAWPTAEQRQNARESDLFTWHPNPVRYWNNKTEALSSDAGLQVHLRGRL